MKIVIVSDRQSLLDIALQEHGNLTGLFRIAIENDKSVTDIITAGEEIIISNNDETNSDIIKYLARKKPATEIQD